MTRTEIITALQQHRTRLNANGVMHAAVFGSVARDESEASSDVDILVDVDPDRVRTVYDLVGIEHEVRQIIPGKVDVAVTSQLRPSLRPRILAEAVYAF